MCSNINIPWRWQINNDPITPLAVVAWYDVVPRLFNHFRQNLSKYDLSKYQFVKGDSFVVIIGKSSLLPWVDGVQYAMFDSQEPRLWLPSHAKPSISTSLLAKAVCHRFSREPVLLWDHPKVVIPLDRQWPLTKEFLQNGL